MRNLVLAMSLFTIATLSAGNALAGRPRCPDCGRPCVTFQTVEKTIQVPVTVMEKRTVTCVEYEPVKRECQVTVMQRVPVTHTVTRLCTVMVPQQRTRTECYTVCKPTWEKVTKEFTALVSEPVVKHGVRTVCKPVHTVEKRVVCRDEGHWISDKCGCCRHWMSNVVKREVEVPVCTTELVEEPYEYTVFVCRPEKRTCTVNVCRYDYEQRTREVPYTVCVPKQIEKKINVTTYKCVPAQRTTCYVEMVPHRVTKEIAVPVCRMVPKTVVCQVPVCCGGK